MTDLRAELAALCRQCGACCRGVMFGIVELDSGELAPHVRRRLAVLPASEAFPQPCAAHDGSGCTMYDERPRGCRDYTCALYRAHEAGAGELLPQKLALVARIRELADRVREAGKPHDGSIIGVVAELVNDRARWSEHRVQMLDLAELAVRLQRDLGWRPPEPQSARADASGDEGD